MAAAVLLEKALAASASAESLEKLVRDLRDPTLRKQLEAEDPSNLLALLNGQLNVEVHSLGWLEVLHVLRKVANGAEEFARHTAFFLSNCHPEQVKLSPQKFSEVASRYAELHTKQATDAMPAVKPLLEAVMKLRRSPEHLTAVHCDFVKICLLTKCYHVAVRVLDSDILYLPTNEELKSDGPAKEFKIEHLLLYYYYGAMVYIGLKRFDRALQFLSVAVTVPAECVSAIMLEAYKKFVLVSLLQHGSEMKLPSYAHSLLRQLRLSSAPYQQLGKSYKQGSVDALLRVISDHAEAYTADKNLGLVKQCLAKLTRQNIKKLTDTFLTLSLADIAKRVNLGSPDEAEAALVGMIADGEIFATINQLTGTVSFHDDPEKYDTVATTTELKAQADAASEIYDKVMKMDRELRTNQRYIKKMAVSDGDTKPGGGASMDFDDAIVAGGMGPM